jgi:hypothetical protein
MIPASKTGSSLGLRSRGWRPKLAPPPHNHGVFMAPKKKITKRILDLRSRLWPDISEDLLWQRKKHDGFTTIPRTLPLIMEIMDNLSGGAPVSRVYFDLWCRAFDECMVTLSKPREMAFHSGFTGQRAESAWRARLRKLADLGFIMIQPGPSGAESYVLILNPHIVVAKMKAGKTAGLTEAMYNALIDRAGEVGAVDIVLPEPPKQSFTRDLDDEVPF